MDKKPKTGEYTGGCHCGNVRYRLATTHTIQELPQRRCGCRFCRKHGAVYTADPSGELLIEVLAPDSVQHYRFSSGVVKFLLCTHCGVLTSALSDIDGVTYAVINANTLDEHSASSQGMVDFDTETPKQARERRMRNWIGRVVIR